MTYLTILAITGPKCLLNISVTPYNLLSKGALSSPTLVRVSQVGIPCPQSIPTLDHGNSAFIEVYPPCFTYGG